MRDRLLEVNLFGGKPTKNPLSYLKNNRESLLCIYVYLWDTEAGR